MLPRAYHRPILPHDLKDVVVYFCGKTGARLLQVAACDENRCLIGKTPSIAEQWLRDLKCQYGRNVRIEQIEFAVCEVVTAVNSCLNVRPGLENLRVVQLSKLCGALQIDVDSAGALQLAERRHHRIVDVVGSRDRRIEGCMSVE